MKLYGTFKNNNDETITVIFYNINVEHSDINIDTSDDIRFSDEPVIISTECEDSFTHIIKTTATINLVTRIWLGDYLYANNTESVIVNVMNGDKCLFAGYVTPNSFNQDFAHDWENLEINCLDYLSLLEYKYFTDETDYDILKMNTGNTSFSDLMKRMKINNKLQVISNLPDLTTNSNWIETGYAYDNNTFTAVESKVNIVNSTTGFKTGDTRISTSLNPEWVQSEDTTIGDDGKLYYKDFAYVDINNVATNTGIWQQGDEAPMPEVVDTVNVLDGWSDGPIHQHMEFFEHFRIDYVMSDGSIKRGDNDTIGEQIPFEPNTTSNGSYCYYVQSGRDDLMTDTVDDATREYYKNYAYIHMTIDGVVHEYNTGQYDRGPLFEPENPGDPVDPGQETRD